MPTIGSSDPVREIDECMRVQAPWTGKEASTTDRNKLLEAIETAHEKFVAEMDDDFNTAGALGAIFELVRATNRFLGDLGVGEHEENVPLLKQARDAISELLDVLGIDVVERKRSEYPDQVVQLAAQLAGYDGHDPDLAVEALLAARAAARTEQNWAAADAVRDGLGSLGFVIEDTSARCPHHLRSEGVTMSDLVEGRNAVIETLRSGVSVRRVFISRGAKAGGAMAEIERLARESDVRIEHVERTALDRMSDHGAHQGVIAEVAAFEFAALSMSLHRIGDAPRSLVLVLDHVTDPGNLGAIVRSAEVAGVDAVVVPSRRTAAVNAVTHKASAGALTHLPLVQETNVARAIESLQAAGYWVAGADGAADTSVWDAEMDGRLVVVLGAEGEGLSRLVKEKCDFLVRIPVAGRVDSLNVAQAATVLAFEWVRRGPRG